MQLDKAIALGTLINTLEDLGTINLSKFTYTGNGLNTNQSLAKEFFMRGHTDFEQAVLCDKELGLTYYYHLMQVPHRKRPRKHSICVLDNRQLLVFISDYTSHSEKKELGERFDVLYNANRN